MNKNKHLVQARISSEDFQAIQKLAASKAAAENRVVPFAELVRQAISVYIIKNGGK